MPEKPTYEELEKRIRGLQQALFEHMRDENDKKNFDTLLSHSFIREGIQVAFINFVHDLNNIFSVINGYAEILLLEGKIPKESKESNYLNRILKAGDCGSKLNESLLRFMNADHPKLKGTTIVPIKFIFEKSMDLISVMFPNIKVIQNLNSNSQVVGYQFFTILINLCINACEAMSEEGGRLEVNIKEIELDSYSKSYYPNLKPGHYLNMTVRDTGQGMSPDVLDHIFDLFFTTKKFNTGAGIGMTVVHNMVERLGGKILAYSEPGKGSTFHVFLSKQWKEEPRRHLD